MAPVRIGDLEKLSTDFLPGWQKDPYRIRNRLVDPSSFRPLEADEIEILVKNGNTAENWNKILVTENFNPNLVRGCEFLGLVRIGDLGNHYLEFHDLRLPVGLVNCVIVSCDIGHHVVMRNIRLIAHYIIGDYCLLFNIDEMTTTNHAKFGAGILKEGESEDVRIWLELGNENGGRRILPFKGMLAADAFLWTKFRGNTRLMQRLKKMTEKTADRRRGYYGIVGSHTVIKNSRIIKDVHIGSHAYIKGSNKLKNLTILSARDESTQIGEGVELVNGIVGYASRIFYGSKAVRFITGRNTQLKYGARLINSYLGDNSTVSCCEILNNLIFPFHEQHHNNSFLIATTVMGQSNIAANATVGSNHNSRSPDGEIIAGRGFWPGLGVSLKHNSTFASFVLIANGRYRNELTIPIPFSLVSKRETAPGIQIMPGYWFLYNMYAVARNNWKFRQRDRRVVKEQHIETEILAPDTVNEMLDALDMLLPVIGAAIEKHSGTPGERSGRKDLVRIAVDMLDRAEPAAVPDFPIEREIDIHLPGFEKSGPEAEIIKPLKGMWVFRQMILYYCISILADYFFSRPDQEFDRKGGLTALVKDLNGHSCGRWWNFGGQLIRDTDCTALIDDVVNASLKDWQDIHARYTHLWENYPVCKAGHACAALHRLLGGHPGHYGERQWIDLLNRALLIKKLILDLTISSRQKDYTSPFRKMVYENQKEMDAVLGKLQDNAFIGHLKQETEAFERKMSRLADFFHT